MKLTKRELDVMKILWNAKKPLMVSEIVQLDNDSTIYSVQRLISNLLKKGMIGRQYCLQSKGSCPEIQAYCQRRKRGD